MPRASRAHPTIEIYRPLLVAADTTHAGEVFLPASAIDGDINYGMLTIDAYTFGVADKPNV